MGWANLPSGEHSRSWLRGMHGLHLGHTVCWPSDRLPPMWRLSLLLGGCSVLLAAMPLHRTRAALDLGCDVLSVRPSLDDNLGTSRLGAIPPLYRMRHLRLSSGPSAADSKQLPLTAAQEDSMYRLAIFRVATCGIPEEFEASKRTRGNRDMRKLARQSRNPVNSQQVRLE